MSQAEIQEKLEALEALEKDLVEVEESASDEFRKWYALNDERSALIEDIRGQVRTEKFDGDKAEYGPFRISRSKETVVDLSTLRRAAPEVLALPGVVKKVDVKALKAALAGGQVSEEHKEDVQDCIIVQEGTPKIYGPKGVKL
jgi:hypothetical protein